MDNEEIDTVSELNLNIEIKQGTECITRGGWKAVVIWTIKPNYGYCFYAVHKPGEYEESAPIIHLLNGTAVASVSVGEPPAYEQHPADIVGPWPLENSDELPTSG